MRDLMTEAGNSALDWEKVGRVYKADTRLDTVLEREFSRLTKSIDARLHQQDENAL
jgi:hypothetical protein